ncbi:hypothetical protein [Burkholderia diffusa]|uniref:hypothetical protein n=1 Tax=Burkholderia diffusa TaxID=488732 RepID=UPI0009BE5D32|nr:hypothetical protein [Burkholderia diffusa]
MKLKPLALVCATAFAACSLDPVYQRPAAPIAGTWPSSAQDADAVAARHRMRLVGLQRDETLPARRVATTAPI